MYIPVMAEPKVLVIVLAGGEGKRMLPLTEDRAKPAVPFGGGYRIIDFALSNFANSRYLKIVVLTQYKSHSLDRHISQTWRFSTLLGNYVTPVPAQMRRGPHWFAGSADAIYQNLNLITDEDPDVVCVFGADHIYRMDATPDGRPARRVRRRRHRRRHPRRATRTPSRSASSSPTRPARSRRSTRSRPRRPPCPATTPAAWPAWATTCSTPRRSSTSSPPPGEDDQYTDIGGHIIPALTAAGVAHVYDFSKNIVPGQDDREKGYWRDVGTIDSYYDANMDLSRRCRCSTSTTDQWPVFTSHESLPPAKISRGAGGEPSFVDGSLLCAGSIVSGGHVERSILSPERAWCTTTRTSPTASLFPGVDHRPRRAGQPLHHRQERAWCRPARASASTARPTLQQFTISDHGIVVIPKGHIF